jgi:hypothetical protein
MQKLCQKIIVDKFIFYLYTSENNLFFFVDSVGFVMYTCPCAHARSVPKIGHFSSVTFQYTERKCSRQPLFLIKNIFFESEKKACNSAFFALI